MANNGRARPSQAGIVEVQKVGHCRADKVVPVKSRDRASRPAQRTVRSSRSATAQLRVATRHAAVKSVMLIPPRDSGGLLVTNPRYRMSSSDIRPTDHPDERLGISSFPTRFARSCRRHPDRWRNRDDRQTWNGLPVPIPWAVVPNTRAFGRQSGPLRTLAATRSAPAWTQGRGKCPSARWRRVGPNPSERSSGSLGFADGGFDVGSSPRRWKSGSSLPVPIPCRRRMPRDGGERCPGAVVGANGLMLLPIGT